MAFLSTDHFFYRPEKSITNQCSNAFQDNIVIIEITSFCDQLYEFNCQ